MSSDLLTLVKDLDRELTGADAYISELETRTLLSGETDHLNAIMTICDPSHCGFSNPANRPVLSQASLESVPAR